MLYILLRGRQGTVANIGSQSMKREARRDRNCQTPNSMDLFRNEYHETGVSIPFHLEERAGRNSVESFVSRHFLPSRTVAFHAQTPSGTIGKVRSIWNNRAAKEHERVMSTHLSAGSPVSCHATGSESITVP